MKTPFNTLAGLLISTVPANADVAGVSQAFVNVCPAALIQDVSPLELGMVEQVDGISRVITKELIATMPGVFWRSDTTDVTMSLPLGGVSCVVSGEVGPLPASLAKFDQWREQHPNLLLIETKTLGQTGSVAGVFMELCLMAPSDRKKHRVIGEINQRSEGWSLNLTLHRDRACKASS